MSEIFFGMFNKLSEQEIIEFKQWARKNYKPGDEIKLIWHPLIVAECSLINFEEIQKRKELKNESS